MRKSHHTHLLAGAFMLLLVPSLAATAAAQEAQAQRAASPQTAVTAAASAGRVRFAAPSAAVQLRLEVYNEAGQKVYDTELRGGNVIDWNISDGSGARVAAGSYVAVVTLKSIAGRLSQSAGVLEVTDQAATLKPAGATKWSAAQAQAVGPIDGDSALVTLDASAAEPATVTANNGTEGQISRTSGPLTFRVGNFFAGLDREQMRLTEDGNLGVGTTKPRAKLDVAGDILSRGTLRVGRGIEFPDGTIQTTAMTAGAAPKRGVAPAAVSSGTVSALTAGTGTANQIAKWIDNAGTLGDSVMSDVGYFSIDSVNNPDVAGSGTLRIQGNANKERIELRSAGSVPGPALQGRGFGGTIAAPTATVAGTDLFIIGGSGYNGSQVVTYNAATVKIKAEENWTPTANGAFINFETTPSGSSTGVRAERMRITGSGNVGIGTTSPQSKLHVNGQTTTNSLQITGGADFAESFDINAARAAVGPAAAPNVKPGMLVSIDPRNPGKLLLSRRAYDRRVAGVISGAGGIEPGMVMGKDGSVATGKYPVALTGRVYCWADASQGAIRPGDLLTTSATPGHAMKVTDHARARGAIIGKAMTGLKSGRGLVLVLVTLQ